MSEVVVEQMASGKEKFNSLRRSTEGIAKRRMVGDEARNSCITTSKMLCDGVKSTLGPSGMYKMMTEEARHFDITKDGASVITGLIVKHPAARLIVETAKAIEDETGDGTTSTIVLAGELIRRADGLIGDGLHPVVIVEGYKLAARKAIEIARELAVKIEDDDSDEMLTRVARTSLKGCGSERLASQVVRAVQLLEGDKDLEYVAFEASEGQEFEDTDLVEGSILHNWTPPGSVKRMEDAKICVILNPIKLERAGYLSEINISSSDIESHYDKEEEILRQMVEKVKNTGANVMISISEIDVRAQGMLGMQDIMYVHKIAKFDYVRHLCLSTGANAVSNIWSLKEEDLGKARLVEERKISEEELIFFEGCENPKACTFFIRAGTPKVIKEHKRNINSAIHSVSSAVKEPFVLPGGGATEVELALRLKKYATTIETKEQLAVMAFAEALEVIPKTLAQNSGLDVIDTIVDLRARHQEDATIGVCIDEEESKVGDTLAEGIVDPLIVRTQMLSGAVEVSELILLADGILQDKKRDSKEEERKQKKASNEKRMEELREMM